MKHYNWVLGLVSFVLAMAFITLIAFLEGTLCPIY